MAKKCCGGCSRRKFLISSTKAALGAAVSAELLSSCNKIPVDIVGDNEQKITTITTADYPELAQIGGSVKIFDIKQEPIIVYRKSETEVKAVYSSCTHKQFQVELPDKDGIIHA